jgi:8-oxo-dGDP phosphatase
VSKPELVNREGLYRGKLITVHRDTLRASDGSTTVREVVDHADSVAVVALDESDRVLLVRQYRHPVGAQLVELPAGLLDSGDKSPFAAMRRELAEETGLAAGWWRTLVDLYPSPGISTERVRVFLARDLRPADGTHHRDADEKLSVSWLPFDEACRQVYAAGITNGLAVAGLLAAAGARADGYGRLRDPDAAFS